MVCSACQDKPSGKPCGTCGKLPPVLEVKSEECPVIFHTVEVEGTPEENAPYMGQYRNVLLVYKGDNSMYLFSSDGVPSYLGDGEGVTDFNELLNRPKYDGQEMTSDTDIPNVTETVAEEATAREAADAELESRIDTTDENLAAEVAARTAADGSLSSSVESLSSSLSSEEAARQAADSTLQDNIDAEATARANADTVIQENIDAIDSAIDATVMTDLVVDPSTSTTVVQLDTTKKNLKTSVTTTDNVPLPVASSTQAGVMNSATYNAVTQNTNNINALINGAVAITGLSANPSQSDLTTAWETATGLSTLMNRAGVYDVTNQKVWTYYTNDATWHAATNTTSVTINDFTNSAAGIIKGSTNIGQVFAESDGTGTVNGWDALKAQADNATSKLSTIEAGAQVNVQADWAEDDPATDAYIKNKPVVDQELSGSSTNAVENRAIDAEFERVAYVDDTIGTQANDIVQLQDRAGDNIYPIAGAATQNSISKSMLEEGVFEGPEIQQPSNVEFVDTVNIADGAVTEEKIDFTLDTTNIFTPTSDITVTGQNCQRFGKRQDVEIRFSTNSRWDNSTTIQFGNLSVIPAGAQYHAIGYLGGTVGSTYQQYPIAIFSNNGVLTGRLEAASGAYVPAGNYGGVHLSYFTN